MSRRDNFHGNSDFFHAQSLIRPSLRAMLHHDAAYFMPCPIRSRPSIPSFQQLGITWHQVGSIPWTILTSLDWNIFFKSFCRQMGWCFHLFHKGMRPCQNFKVYIAMLNIALVLYFEFRQTIRNCKRASYRHTLACHLERLVTRTWYPTMTFTAKEIASSPRLELSSKGNLIAPFSVFVKLTNTVTMTGSNYILLLLLTWPYQLIFSKRYSVLRSWYYDRRLFIEPCTENQETVCR